METENSPRPGLVYSILKSGVAALPRSLKDAVVTRIIHAQPETIRRAIQNLQHEVLLDQIVRDSKEQFQRLSGRENLKLHLGCGSELTRGWVNIDANLYKNVPSVDPSDSETVFINHDLRRGLPLDDQSCDFIYSSHFFEHLECEDGIQLMRECYRVLQPGGVFRISLPNFKRFFEAYIRDDKEYIDELDLKQLLPEVEAGTECYADIVNYSVYQKGEHKCIYDEEKLILVLQKIGFRNVVESPYRESIDPTSELRRRYSFYVEGVK